MPTLNSQVWIDQIMKNYYPESTFLSHITDLTSYVEFDKINLSETGLDPEVLINNTTYPISIAQRSDTPIAIELDLFETENTLVRSPEVVELSYDKMESVVKGHRNALRLTTAQKGAHAIAPQNDTAKTPVLATSGADNGNGKKRLTIADILKLKRRFDEVDIPQEKRFLVLCSQHVEDLLLQNTEIFKDLANYKEGKLNQFAGFTMLEYTRNPKYNSSNLTKLPFSAAPSGTDSECSFAFQKDEVMKADGTMKMYANIDDPKERASTVGFDKRFICMPFRNQGIGAIVSVNV